ncbi:MAG TPA: Flp family type IVb pilin [Azospirillum sp.]|nr:Flp family type IVb pilin [Azospirillum sp.]
MKTRILARIVHALSDRRGVTALEYGLVAALAAVAIITAMANLGTDLDGVFTAVNNKLTSTAAGIK